mmetsp:Transcript_27780/g.37623  ORF Transcript_27780/g.37623 Transcript_27780/m.37623 type:complete len:201 (-) Transcript_27780:653-1255(-)
MLNTPSPCATKVQRPASYTKGVSSNFRLSRTTASGNQPIVASVPTVRGTLHAYGVMKTATVGVRASVADRRTCSKPCTVETEVRSSGRAIRWDPTPAFPSAATSCINATSARASSAKIASSWLRPQWCVCITKHSAALISTGIQPLSSNLARLAEQTKTSTVSMGRMSSSTAGQRQRHTRRRTTLSRHVVITKQHVTAMP